MRHGLEAEISDIRLPGLDELAKLGRDLLHQGLLGVQVNNEIDGLEQDSVLGVVLLYVLVRLHGNIQNLLERLSNHLTDMAVLCDLLELHLPKRHVAMAYLMEGSIVEASET